MTAADEPVVSIVSEPAPDAGVELGTLWLAVSRAGGAVGFLPDSPEPQIRAAAEQVIADVREGREQMLTIDAGGVLAGTVLLRRGAGVVAAHRCEVTRLMVHPERQGRGWGRALLAAAVTHAREQGVEQLLLSTRGGTALPSFYEELGWTEVGVFPGALRLGPDEVRDEHWFQLRL